MSAFLETSDRIARQLCRDALWDGTRCNWLGWSLELVGGRWANTWRALSGGLYSGTAGVALFLARLAPWTRDPLVRETLLGALRQARQAAAGLPPEDALSFYSGPAGTGYACIEAGLALDDDSLVRDGLDLLSRAAAQPPDERSLDVVAGSAGLIPALIDTARRFGREDLMDAAVAHGRLLLATAHRSAAGWSWATLPHVPRHLLGFAHGASGMAWALAELYAVTGEAGLREGALEAVRYERSQALPDLTWPDLRAEPSPVPAPAMNAWCHGAPGIGMARLRLLELLGAQPGLAEDLGVALRATAAELASESGLASFCLCHGAGGNAELLLLAAGALGQPWLRQQAEAAAWQGIARYHQTGLAWPCGVQGAGETPNLLLGLAGIGYFYLRLHGGAAVPSILQLTPSTEALAGRQPERLAGVEEMEEEPLAAAAAG
ncbi:MAG TPA: lanthionine synthetase LanC family protein [Thermoanaerobaculia bacterium]|nr:lanthionine synthetase LanC family protein [Thermoanaerobaculia bacterium]